jgi:hypothetical protein
VDGLSDHHHDTTAYHLRCCHTRSWHHGSGFLGCAGRPVEAFQRPEHNVVDRDGDQQRADRQAALTGAMTAAGERPWPLLHFGPRCGEPGGEFARPAVRQGRTGLQQELDGRRPVSLPDENCRVVGVKSCSDTC